MTPVDRLKTLARHFADSAHEFRMEAAIATVHTELYADAARDCERMATAFANAYVKAAVAAHATNANPEAQS